ncbi:sulfotransferase 1E1-like [Patiria miniata]|uniref:Sulfotransferase domain-containing protein n=1 Tax=Patiria miniata TaxID=46514 RepID=A0A914AQJ3_PATMI|nr:sulfotransferase 1E1-like [Patiria miniata]XP_038066031.1 sulfotransferase 1E1-like [Patiria miniata]XP_038066032.1 sulfotransferase 1E1-like [Patiria miniata]
MEKYVTLEEYREMWKSLHEFLSHQPAGQPSVHSEVDGINLPLGMTTVLEAFRHFKVRQDDVWMVTFPKAGTTWAQEIISCVMYDGNLEEVKTKNTMFRVLFLEMNLPDPIRKAKNFPLIHEIAEEMPSPRVLKTHLPGPFLPPQLWEKKPKIVYVMRNPKDVVVSYFYFLKMMNPTPDSLNESFGEFFDRMLTGSAFYGPWWDHYLYFWEKRKEPNILLLRYEDMKRDLRGNVEKISRFLCKNLPAEKLDAITDYCTFANMKKNPMTNQDYVFAQKDSPYLSMRKGIVGDWKTHFTVAQNEAMDALIKEKLHGTGLTFEYE